MRPQTPRALKELCAFAALAALIAGCAGAPAESLGRVCETGADVAVPGPGSAGSHGEPQRDDGEVEVTREGAEFRARRVVTVVNDFGGAAQSDVTFATQNGTITSCPDRSGGYGVQAELVAYGATEDAARQALASLVVRHDDVLLNGTLSLNTTVEFRAIEEAPEPLPLPGTGNERRRASLSALLPSGVRHAFHHSNENGDVQAIGFAGTVAELDTTNGSVLLAGVWDQATLETTNGMVYAAGNFAGLDASTTNGSISAVLETTRDTTAVFDASNSMIDVGLAVSGDPGFDLAAETTNGRAAIRVRGAQPVGEQQPESAHHQSPDYTSHAVQVAVSASNTNGDIAIHD